VNNKILISHPEQLSKQWAQRVMGAFVADGKVSDVYISSVDIGTTTRLKVVVEHDVPEIIPTQWFVKLPSLVLKSRLITALPGLLHKEIQFYKTVSAQTSLHLPKILAAEKGSYLGATLVMSDVTASGFRPGQAQDVVSLTQARLVVEHLAQFHASNWQRPDLLSSYPWLGGFKADIENHLGTLMAVPLMRRGLTLADTLIPIDLHRPALNYARNRRRIMKMLSSGPLTMVHHDCHPGNFFWTDTGPGFLDWQLVRVGEGVGDIAYFLATSLEPEVRRAHERELLAAYVETLNNLGIVGLQEERLFAQYRAHTSYAFEAMVVTLAIGEMMDLTANLELIRRTVAAVIDNDSFAEFNL
jgi:hypothetical protein